MFSDVKFEDELIYCKDIKEDETGKTYTFETGETIHLDKDTKICSELIDRKVIIEKNGKYGAVVFYNDKILEDFDKKIERAEYDYDDDKKRLIEEYDEKNKEIVGREKQLNKNIDFLNEELQKIESNEDKIFKTYSERFDQLSFRKAILKKMYSDSGKNVEEDDSENILTDKEIEKEVVDRIGRYDTLKNIEKDSNLFGKEDIDRQLNIIKKLEERKEEALKSRDEDIKKANDDVSKKEKTVEMFDNSLKKIEKLIEHVSNSDIDYINNFIKNLKDDKDFVKENKVEILMSLNDVEPYISREVSNYYYEYSLEKYEKIKYEYDKKYEYYETQLFKTGPVYEGKNLTKQVMNLRDVAYNIDVNKSRSIEKLNRAKNDLKSIESKVERIEKEIEDESAKLELIIRKNIKKVDIVNEMLIADKERFIINKTCSDKITAYFDVFNEIKYSESKLGFVKGAYDFELNGHKIEIYNYSRDVGGSFSEPKYQVFRTIKFDGWEIYNSEGHNKFRGDYEQFELLVTLFNNYFDEVKNTINKEKKKLDKKLEKEIDALTEERDRKINEEKTKKENPFNIIEPNYDKVSIGEGYINAQDQDNFYLFDGYGKQAVEEKKAKDFKVITGGTIFNDNTLYEGISRNPARMYYSKDKEMIYISIRTITPRGSFKSIVKIYDKNTDLISTLEPGYSFEYIDKISLTSDNKIIKVNGKFFNVINGKYCCREAMSDFKDGHAYAAGEHDIAVLLDTSFNEKICDFHVLRADNSDNNDLFKLKDDYGFMPVYTRNLNDKKYGANFGYADFYGNLVIPCKYKYESAKKALEKRIKSLNKYDEKLNKWKEKRDKKISKQPVKEELKLEVNNGIDEIYALEDKIKDYLSKLKIDKLNNKFKMMQRDYKNNIVEASKNDIEINKNVLLSNVSLQLSDASSAKLTYKNYKNELNNFIKQIEDNIYIVDVLDKLNTFENVFYGENIETKDTLLIDMKELYDLYSNLNDKSRKRNITNLKKLIDNEKDYFKKYFFRTDYNDKLYNSRHEWETAFRKKLEKLIYEFKNDFEFKQIQDQINNLEKVGETLKDNKFKSVVLYNNEIKKIIDEIESRTDDELILKELDKYRDIKIDYNKTPEENIKEIQSNLMGIMKYQHTVNKILDSEIYTKYETNRNTK